MSESSVQPPRYTSTPRAGRDTFNCLQNFNEVSPIFPGPDIIRKSKSSIPISLNNRSNWVRSSNTKPKVSSSASNNSTGQGSSGSVKIPPQIHKLQVEKNIPNCIAQGKAADKIPSQDTKKMPKRKTPEKAVKRIPKVFPTGSEVKPQAFPANTTSQVAAISVSQTKPLVSTAVSTGTNITPYAVAAIKVSQTKPLLSTAVSTGTNIDEVIDSVIRFQPQKESKTSSRDSNFHVREEGNIASIITRPSSTEGAQAKPYRVSKIFQRPSTLAVVPEESALQGISQESGEDVFKSSKANSGWLVPKEIKARVSLKRKSNVPTTVTKRTKKPQSNDEHDDGSLFGSPEMPNLVETTSLVDRRKTHVLKKKPKITEVEEHKEMETDCVIPLDPKQKYGVSEIKVSEDKHQKTESNTTLRSKNTDKENIGELVSSNVDKKNKSKVASHPKNQLNESIESNSLNKGTDIKPRRTLRERKANINYEDKSDIINNDKKGTTRKNKSKQTLKSSQEVKENSNEPPVESKNQRKKTVKEIKTQIIVNPMSDEIPIQHEGKGSGNTDVIPTLNNIGAQEKNNKGKGGKKNTGNKKKTKLHNSMDSEMSDGNKLHLSAKLRKESDSQQDIIKKDDAVASATKSTKRKTQAKKQASLAKCDLNQGSEKLTNVGVSIDNESVESVSHGANSFKTNSNEIKATPKMKKSRKTVSKKRTDEDISPKKAAEESAACSLQNKKIIKEDENKTDGKIGANKKSFKNNTRGKPKSGSVSEHIDDRSSKMTQDGIHMETGSCVLATGKKRKSEEVEYGDSHSGQESSSKRQKRDDRRDTNEKYNINDLFGSHKIIRKESQPGVVSVSSLHIDDFLMMGEVTVEPGAVLSRITTNTAYSVVKGSACVTIKKVTKYFNEGDEHRRFFIPRNIEVCVTNPEDVPLKMEFVKFRGKREES